jgi:hypothetical protein
MQSRFVLVSRGPAELQQTLANLMVGIVVGLRSRREGAVGGPKIDQRLHGLKLLRLEHIEGASRQDEVRKTAVELLLKVEVVERVDEMGPVEMRIDTEHLSKDGLAHVDKVVRESASLAHPFTLAGASQLRQGRCRRGRVIGVGDAVGVGREDICVINLSRYPTLHQCDVLGRRELDRFPLAVQPGERVVSRGSSVSVYFIPSI